MRRKTAALVAQFSEHSTRQPRWTWPRVGVQRPLRVLAFSFRRLLDFFELVPPALGSTLVAHLARVHEGGNTSPRQTRSGFIHAFA